MKAEWGYSHSPPKLLGIGYRRRQTQTCWKFPACPCPSCSTYSSSSQCPVLLMASDSLPYAEVTDFGHSSAQSLYMNWRHQPSQILCNFQFVPPHLYFRHLGNWICSDVLKLLFSAPYFPGASDYVMSYFYNKSLIPQNSQWFYLLYWIQTHFVLFPLSYSLSLTIYFQSTFMYTSIKELIIPL